MANVAIYTGGELNYMRIADYNLSSNPFFDDPKHPSMITLEEYSHDNERIFSVCSLSELQGYMPENPTWMNGARACSVLAQAICSKYGIQYIIPSDSNIIDGVCDTEFKSVTVCGSFRKHLDSINKVIDCFKAKGIQVLSPKKTTPVAMSEGFVLFHGELVKNNRTWPIERKHLLAIDESDAVVVCDFDGYIGRSTSCEIGYAIAKGKRVIFLDGRNLKEFDFPCEIGLLNS